MKFGKLFTKRKNSLKKFLHGKFKQQQQKLKKLESSDKNCGWIREAY